MGNPLLRRRILEHIAEMKMLYVQRALIVIAVLAACLVWHHFANPHQSLPVEAQQGVWLTDFGRAQAEAGATNKPILLNFTGSDWCDGCIRMDKEALNTPQFIDYASKNLILVLVDFPLSTKLPPLVQSQNFDLQKRYAVDGFPTFILLNKNGDVLGKEEGYIPGGPSAFIAKLESYRH
jgi:thioredoxin-related protein